MPKQIYEKNYECTCGFKHYGFSGPFTQHLRAEGKKEPNKHQSKRIQDKTPAKLSANQVVDPGSRPENAPTIEADVKTQPAPASSQSHEVAAPPGGNGDEKGQFVGFRRPLNLSIVADAYYKAALDMGWRGSEEEFIIECITGYFESKGYALRLVNLLPAQIPQQVIPQGWVPYTQGPDPSQGQTGG